MVLVIFKAYDDYLPMALILEKNNIRDFLKQLSKKYKIIVPVKKGKATVFEIFSNESILDLSYETTDTSVKKFFFKPEENLLSFDGGKADTPLDDEKTIVFGLQMIDAAALKIQDEAFEKPIPDLPYLQRRRNSTIVAFENSKSPNSFHEELDIDYEGVADAIFLDAGDSYKIEAKTRKGEELVKNKYVKGGHVELKTKKERKSEKIDMKKVKAFLDMGPENNLWTDLAKECLACGACSFVCPICHCFDVYDRLDLSGKKGERIRCWDSCMLYDFAAVAGDGNFRPKRHERIHNWYHHKFSRAITERGKPDCIGCGRCITHCPAKIDIYDVLKKCEAKG
jgi:sulfhydrogenase subunit beta (sulfur reductase)